MQRKEMPIDAIVEKYETSITAYIVSYVKDWEKAKDLCQDLFLQLTIKFNQGYKIENAEHYLFRAAKNTVINYWKKTASQQALIDDYYNHIQQQARYNETILEHDKQLIFSILEKQMSDQQSKVFRLHRIDGLTYSEIADSLNISRSTVKNHMIIALQKIRYYMSLHADELISILLILSYFKNH
ncbi:RNA polymerase sigma factor [Membranihabitans marinus]|uniref:RNA polymerase sigma factor n=1 Tax=Membranihabitans marinus TaxID=1227546 RepID=UPI001F0252DF|nr:sigma-70 family RNA polymerase sigma factor [Membranihabitans marinus]